MFSKGNFASVKNITQVKFHCVVDTQPKGKKKKTKKHQIIHNTIITVGENKLQQGEATVSADAHMFESRDE